MKRAILFLLSLAALASGHPMGNFSVSHYARFEVTGHGVELHYALDLAELPTFDLLRSWKLERTSPRSALERKAREQAQAWVNRLQITANGKAIHPKLRSVDLVIADGAGNLPIVRIGALAHLDGAGGTLAYEDSNFPDRAGWKEIVILAAEGATLQRASQTDKDVSRGLTQYPSDPTLAPPQDLRAEMNWSVERPILAERKPTVIEPLPQPTRAPVGPPPATATPAAAAPGTVVRGDFLSRLLHEREITPWMILVGIAAAFVLGAAHALTPGHGKTIVAAYLVGSRGTLKHAVFLGGMVTFTHTISVFALGLATLFLFQYVMPEKIVQALGAISGLSIVAIGAWMVTKRLKAARHQYQHEHHLQHNHHHQDHGHNHDHHDHPHHDHPHHDHPHHDHPHHDHPHHDHDHHDHDHHDHDHHDHPHHHGPGSHTHMPDEISWAGLTALGASGGLVPCESALILLLGAIALHRVGLGLVLLVSFSAGLALVLMVIGAMVLFARNLLPDHKRSSTNPFFRWLPVASSAVVIIIGLIMTGISLGWIRPTWMIG
jgi:nickel/cobalt exporter